MTTDPIIVTLAETIIWVAQQRIADGIPYQDINSAIIGVSGDVSYQLCKFMAAHKGGTDVVNVVNSGTVLHTDNAA